MTSRLASLCGGVGSSDGLTSLALRSLGCALVPSGVDCSFVTVVCRASQRRPGSLYELSVLVGIVRLSALALGCRRSLEGDVCGRLRYPAGAFVRGLGALFVASTAFCLRPRRGRLYPLTPLPVSLCPLVASTQRCRRFSYGTRLWVFGLAGPFGTAWGYCRLLLRPLTFSRPVGRGSANFLAGVLGVPRRSLTCVLPVAVRDDPRASGGRGGGGGARGGPPAVHPPHPPTLSRASAARPPARQVLLCGLRDSLVMCNRFGCVSRDYRWSLGPARAL